MTRLTDEQINSFATYNPAPGAERLQAAHGVFSLLKEFAQEIREHRASNQAAIVAAIVGNDDGTMRRSYLTGFEMLVLETLRDDIAEYEHHDVNVVRILDKIIGKDRK